MWLGARALRPWGAGEGGWSPAGTGQTFGRLFGRSDFGRTDGRKSLLCSIGHRSLPVRCPKKAALTVRKTSKLPGHSPKLMKNIMLLLCNQALKRALVGVLND